MTHSKIIAICISQITLAISLPLLQGCNTDKPSAKADVNDSESVFQANAGTLLQDNRMRFRSRRVAVDFAIKKHPGHLASNVSMLPGGGGTFYYATVRTYPANNVKEFVTTNCIIRAFFKEGIEEGQELDYELVATPLESFPPSVYNDITRTMQGVPAIHENDASVDSEREYPER